MGTISLFARCTALLAVAKGFVNTSSWSGAEYTPARAPGNGLWWARFADYAADVDFELNDLKRRYGFTVLRMFLHSAVYEADSDAYFTALDSFLTIADKNGLQAGFVFFDDCWNTDCWWQANPAVCNISEPCTPIKGRHNGCWVTSPLAADRTSVERYLPFVADTVSWYAGDSRVAYWEIFNEPVLSNNFTMALRNASYFTALSAGPTQPVLSCWNDNENTQAVDVHHYDVDFPSLTTQVFANISKGAAITEGGSRWFQNYTSDAGSPKTFITWYEQLHAANPSPAPPASFPFGMIINWEGMVGGSNTRWHWATPDGSPEPVIPWDAHMFPDGTPVSHTEAALIRGWTTGQNDFIGYVGFLPNATWSFSGDYYLTLASGAPWTLGVDGVVGVNAASAGYLTVPCGSLTDFVVETTVWPTNGTGGGVVLRASVSGSGTVTGYFAGFRATDSAHPLLVVEAWTEDSTVLLLGSFDMSTLDCGLTLQGWNMLRATIQGSTLESLQVTVFANPMYNESLASGGIQPRITLKGMPASVPLYAAGDATLVAVSDSIPVLAGPVAVVQRSPPLADILGREMPASKAETIALLQSPAGAGALQAAFDAPIIPLGYTAFDYLGVLPLAVL